MDEVLEESVHVRKDLGYPIMITPLSQFVVTQAAINVATGERYKHVIDELILFAQGVYGEDSGYTVMDQNLKDRLLSTQRAAELASRQRPNVTLQDLRASLGGTAVSDEEFLLRYIMKGDQENPNHARGRPAETVPRQRAAARATSRGAEEASRRPLCQPAKAAAIHWCWKTGPQREAAEPAKYRSGRASRRGPAYQPFSRAE